MDLKRVIAIVICLASIAPRLALATTQEGEDMLTAEAAARWGYMHCPGIEISPMVLMLAGVVSKNAAADVLEASRARFDALMTERFETVDEGCESIAPFLAGSGKP